MKLRVVDCETGNVGIEALRGIRHHPDLELVGQTVWSAEQVGVDAGKLAGEAPVGVRAVNDWALLLVLDADIAWLTRFLPSDEAACITRTLIPCDGGTAASLRMPDVSAAFDELAAA